MSRPCGRVFASILAAALLTTSPPLASASLSDESVREAYFLGQRNNESTAEFLERYIRRLPMPESGLYVSEVELLTPYAEVVDLSRQRTAGYSAQQAAQEYKQRGDIYRLRVRFLFTDTYPQNTYAAVATSRSSRDPQSSEDSAPRHGSSQALQVVLRQKGKRLDPLEIPGVPVYRGFTEGDFCGDMYCGFDVILHYSADDISRDDTDVVVLTPHGQHVVATFDLASLR